MLDTITSPTLLISKSRVIGNIARMAERAKRHGLALRPHFKTHQSQDIGKWFEAYGVEEISVTSLRMAREFAGFGWPKIIIAMPVNPRELSAIAALTRTSEISVFLSDQTTAGRMKDELPAPLPYFIELNAGYGRTGVSVEDVQTIVAIIEAAGHHYCRGFYVHSGHTYDAGSREEIDQIHTGLMAKLARLQKDIQAAVAHLPSGHARERMIEPFEYAIGDTPACSTQEDFTGITSIGPGNFVYYDLVQAHLGSCSADDIAAYLAAPIVQVFPERGEVVIHGGWVQLGKDHLPDGTYGRLVHLRPDGSRSSVIPNAAVVKLSQEHGTLRLPADELAKFKPGDLIGVLPVHACALVHGMRATGEQRIV